MCEFESFMLIPQDFNTNLSVKSLSQAMGIALPLVWQIVKSDEFLVKPGSYICQKVHYLSCIL